MHDRFRIRLAPLPVLSLLLLVVLLFSGCTFSLPRRYTTVSVLSYNVQNLCDDRSDGNEYEEFDPSRSRWSTAEYYRRLQDISRVIRDASKGGPDVVAFQEIEHVGVLEDLRDRYLGGLGYRYVCAAEPDGSPIVVGVLSRLPIVSAYTHGARIDSQIPIRPMLEVELDAGFPLRLIVCHWKSKSGGAEQTEPYRIAAAQALVSVISERLAEDPSVDIVVVGDLNEQPQEYRHVRGAYPTALLVRDAADDMLAEARGIVVDCVLNGADLRDADAVTATDAATILYSPWLSSVHPGSYRYRGVWEQIDHALLSASCFDGSRLEYAGFEVVAPAYALTSDGAPLAYSTRSGTGFSDHLPVLLTLEVNR